MGGDMGKVLQLFKKAAQQETEQDRSPKPVRNGRSGCMVKGETVIIINGDWVMCCEKKGQDR